MPVIVMEVIGVENHPNADSLRVYQMKTRDREEVQIIANLENIYEIGDAVAIALIDSILKDGTKIKPSKLRGLRSFGMALGKVEDPVGTDLSEVYCQKQISKPVQFQKWSSIELLHNLCRSLELFEPKPTITYRAKIKLDGTNAGVQIFPDGKVAAQSRTQIITPENDNMGFANWVHQNIEFFSNLASSEHLIVFGEWCGKGIQKRTAISKIDRKIFVIFALQYGGIDGQIATLEICPEKIQSFLANHPDIFILPFYGNSITLDFSDKEQLKTQAEILNQKVKDVENIDPWVKETFGIEGIGEGLVFYPEASNTVERLSCAELLFKAKGEKHQVVKTKKPIQIDPEKVKSIDGFVDLFVTQNRLEQGVNEACNGEFNIKKMGVFLQWFVGDVKKESTAEIERAQLTWKEVNKPVMNAARKWYLERAKSI
ncbi:hypothetical protein IQ249_24455 [Lusitaniella coriacea LEGE 07157]|uniref:tRNA-binding domain-containing protein n=1 Tax=Lusitaniella coriacea LEGE 07157 TaxID=945747 RepID=A0A8J7J6X8_9CYAN|nr:RNA ligase family protein [Lusitaniella coriacea]MBE9119044.1 hypothetical protein [Lusitaniella coriacea LEGE 07157]